MNIQIGSSLPLRSLTATTMHLDSIRCTNTFLRKVTRGISTETRDKVEPCTLRFPKMWTRSKLCHVLFGNLHTWSHAWLCKRHGRTKSKLGRTSRRSLQQTLGLDNVHQREMSILNYTLKIKELCDSLDSINVIVDEESLVNICPRGLPNERKDTHPRSSNYNPCC